MRVQILLALLFAFGATGSADESEKSFFWGKAILGTRVDPINRPSVDVGYITERAGMIIGYCSLANVPDGTYTPVELQIRGEWRGDEFWPAVEYQVGNQYKGPWRTIKAPRQLTSKRNLVVKAGEVVPRLWVSFEPLRNFIGKYVVGKIVLSSGDGGVVGLGDLIPPTPSTP
jgi:hypothetical protein